MFFIVSVPVVFVPPPDPPPVSYAISSLPTPAPTVKAAIPEPEPSPRPEMPFYSQFTDITSPVWKKVGCGITSLAMIIDYYLDGKAPSVDTLLSEGIAARAYLKNVGWTYAGLISVSKKYGFTGESHDLGKLTKAAAFETFKKLLDKGPLIASVHYRFDPKSVIPHLVVINRMEGGLLVYNDPAASGGSKKIGVPEFLAAWKKRFIVIRPAA